MAQCSADSSPKAAAVRSCRQHLPVYRQTNMKLMPVYVACVFCSAAAVAGAATVWGAGRTIKNALKLTLQQGVSISECVRFFFSYSLSLF